MNASSSQGAPGPVPFGIETADGYQINGFVWRHTKGRSGDRPVVIINSATSVRCRYYSRFASFLFGEGFDVITYDYRGIGESRPVSLRGFDAGWIDMQAVTIRRLRVRHALHEGHPVVLREPLATVAQY